MISVTNFYDITWCCVYIAGLAESTHRHFIQKKQNKKTYFLLLSSFQIPKPNLKSARCLKCWATPLVLTLMFDFQIQRQPFSKHCFINSGPQLKC